MEIVGAVPLTHGRCLRGVARERSMGGAERSMGGAERRSTVCYLPAREYPLSATSRVRPVSTGIGEDRALFYF